ncbi:MAG: methyl-accepting chemotaxis protein [Mariprofundaceae bacterium]
MNLSFIWRRGSVVRQVVIAMSLVLFSAITFNMYHDYQQSTQRMLEQVELQVRSLNASYFDSLNMLMLAGVMDDRELLRQKILKMPYVMGARVIRSTFVSDQYGAGLASEKAIDALDAKALSGQEVLELSENSEGDRSLTLIMPYKATHSTRGVNCLQCHSVPAGTVNGAIRIHYDLSSFDREIKQNLLNKLWINFGVAFMAMFFLALYLKWNLTRGLKDAEMVACSIAKGDMNIEIPTIRHDNIGRVMYALRDMRDALVKSFLERNKMAEAEQALLVNKLEQQKNESKGLHSFESGLVHVVGSVKEVTEDVRGLSLALNSSSQQLGLNAHHASEEVLKILQEVGLSASEIERVNSAMAKTVEESQQSLHVSKQAMLDAQATSISMQALLDTAEKIGSVVALINKIADQTNLLALNASIEAARAGDAGRGFAVVAQEVKSLAQQTASSTDEIAQQVESIQSESRGAASAILAISATVEQMHKQTQSAAETLQANSQLAEAVSARSQVIEQGMNSIREVVVAVEGMAESTADLSTDIAKCSDAMDDVSEEQQQLIDQFLMALGRTRRTEKKADDDEHALF